MFLFLHQLYHTVTRNSIINITILNKIRCPTSWECYQFTPSAIWSNYNIVTLIKIKNIIKYNLILIWIHFMLSLIILFYNYDC